MKKIFVIWCALLFLCTSIASAKVIVQKEAHDFASKFFNQSPSARGNNEVIFSWDSNALQSDTRSSTEVPAFYVFTRPGGKGFIIVSGEDTTYPVLGYSFNEPIGDVNQLPINISGWLTQLADAIYQLRAENLTPSQEVKSMWKSPAIGNIIIQHKTALWDQSEPFNKYAPLDEGKKCFTGCVPTAVGIVMRFHKWPLQGNGSTETYITKTKKIQVEARDLNHPYYWDRMPLNFNMHPDQSQVDNVATLLADIGSVFKVDYTKDATPGLLRIKSLFENFDYSPSMNVVRKDDYKADTWTQLIRTELDASRPVLYSGHSKKSGHEFVLDGYTDDSFFHVNWGWGDYLNGYFRISSLTPSLDISYPFDHSMLLNFEPNNGQIGKPKDWIKFAETGIQISETEFETGHEYVFQRLFFRNCFVKDFTGQFIGAHTDKNGIIKELVVPKLGPWTIEGNSAIYYSDISFVIKEPINIGDRIRFYYKEKGSDKMELIKGTGDKVCWEILIADEYYIHETTSFAFDKVKGIITLETKKGVHVTLFDPLLVPTTQGITQQGNSIIIQTKGLKSGKYTLKLQKGGDEKEIQFEIKSL